MFLTHIKCLFFVQYVFLFKNTCKNKTSETNIKQKCLTKTPQTRKKNILTSISLSIANPCPNTCIFLFSKIPIKVDLNGPSIWPSGLLSLTSKLHKIKLYLMNFIYKVQMWKMTSPLQGVRKGRGQTKSWYINS